MPKLTALVRPSEDPLVRSAAAFVLERKLQLGAEGGDLAVVDDEVLLDHLGNAQIAQRLRRPLDGDLRRFLPGFGAGTDQLDDFVNAVGHGSLPRHGSSFGAGSEGGGAAAIVPCRPFPW